MCTGNDVILPLSRCHQNFTLPSLPKARAKDGWDIGSHPLIHVFIHPLLTTHTRGGGTPHYGMSHQPTLPCVLELGTTWELQFPGVLEGSHRQQRSESSLPGSLRSSPAASRELSLRSPLQLSSAQLRVPTSLAASREYEKPTVADCDVRVSMRFKTSYVSPCSVACAAKNEVK